MATSPPVFTDGEAYERMMGQWSRLAGAAFLDWLDIPAGLRLLDVGCGNGAFTDLVAERCAPAAVKAIDPSEGQLAYARHRTAAGNVEYSQGDAQALPFGDNEFDAALMALAINFVPDPAKAVAEMGRVVRPGGKVATYMWDVHGGGFPMEPIRVALGEMDVAAPIPGADVVRMDAMDALWRAAGLVDVSTMRIDITVTYADFDDFWVANTAIGNSVANAVKALSEADVEQLKGRLREILPTGDGGGIAYGAFANAVKGTVR